MTFGWPIALEPSLFARVVRRELWGEEREEEED